MFFRIALAVAFGSFAAFFIWGRSPQPINIPDNIADAEQWLENELIIRWAQTEKWPLEDRIVQRAMIGQTDYHQAPIAILRLRTLLTGYQLKTLDYEPSAHTVTTLYTLTFTSSTTSDTEVIGPATPGRLASLVGSEVMNVMTTKSVVHPVTHAFIRDAWLTTSRTEVTTTQPANQDKHQQEALQKWFKAQRQRFTIVRTSELNEPLQ